MSLLCTMSNSLLEIVLVTLYDCFVIVRLSCRQVEVLDEIRYTFFKVTIYKGSLEVYFYLFIIL